MDKAYTFYEEGRCPDCGMMIDLLAEVGESCPNCGHVWWNYVVDDETLRILELAKRPNLAPTMTGNSAFPIAPIEHKPCDIPCCKCGSNDIHRAFYIQQSAWTRSIGARPKRKTTEFAEYWPSEGKALKDFLLHHCRCCGYEWESKPLS